MEREIKVLLQVQTSPLEDRAGILLIDISPYLTNSQVSAAIRLTTNGDAYMLNTVGLQININSPNIQATKSVNKSVAAIGDILTYTVTIPNTGLLPANNVIFIDSLPNGTSFIPGTVTVDNVPQTNANPRLVYLLEQLIMVLLAQ